jgi:hypothetical protein
MKLSGGCLCGAVRYEADAAPAFQVKCYCSDCRKTSAAGHAAMMGFPKDKVRVEGDVRAYVSKADSGADAARAFCPICGAGVYATNSSMSHMIFLRASTLDDPSLFAPQLIVYASRAPAWDPVNRGVPSFPEAPPGPP